MNRDEIIRDVARTLFLCAYADGVEAGEIAGEDPGAGGDWDDVAPAAGDPNADREALRIVDAFDEHATLVLFASLERARAQGTTEEDLLPRHEGQTAVELAAAIHAERTGTDRFAPCLAMQSLGSGVGLSDDLRPGDRLPDWIRASVPSSDFGHLELDPERYPSVDWSVGTDVRIVHAHQTPGGEAFRHGETVTLLEDARPGEAFRWDVYAVRRADGTEACVYGFNLAPCLPD